MCKNYTLLTKKFDKLYRKIHYFVLANFLVIARSGTKWSDEAISIQSGPCEEAMPLCRRSNRRVAVIARPCLCLIRPWQSRLPWRQFAKKLSTPKGAKTLLKNTVELLAFALLQFSRYSFWKKIKNLIHSSTYYMQKSCQSVS